MVFDPAQFRKKTVAAILFFFIAAAALAIRLSMLQTVERRLDADESIVGLMGKHISEGEKIPFFFYGQHYGGGHVIEALAAAGWRGIRPGPSAGAVQAAPIFFSILILCLVFSYTREKTGPKPAFLSVILLAFSTPFLKSSLKADGYIETIFFGMLALNLLMWSEKAADARKPGKAGLLAAATGIALSTAVWSYDFGIIYLAVVFLAALPKAARNPARLIFFIVGIVLGAAPLIYYNISNDYAHLKHFFSGGPGGMPSPSDIISNIAALFSSYLPAFFTPDCVHNFVLPPPLYAWAAFAAVAVSFLCLALFAGKVPFPVVAIPALVFILFSVSGYAGRSPRYLLPAEPFLSISVAMTVCFLFYSSKTVLRISALVILALFSFGAFSGNTALFTDHSIVEGNMKTSPDSLVNITSILKENKVKCIYTTYFIKWSILFLSDENITAVDSQAGKREHSYSKYENAGCPPEILPTFVLHKSSPFLPSLPQYIDPEKVKYKIFYTSDHYALIPIVGK